MRSGWGVNQHFLPVNDAGCAECARRESPQGKNGIPDEINNLKPTDGPQFMRRLVLIRPNHKHHAHSKPAHEFCNILRI